MAASVCYLKSGVLLDGKVRRIYTASLKKATRTPSCPEGTAVVQANISSY